MVVNRLFLVTLFISSLVVFLDKAAAQFVETNKEPEQPQIIERIIKIEGTVEKPRVLFIISRARIWKEDPMGKSFFDDILKPVHPEMFLKDLGI